MSESQVKAMYEESRDFAVHAHKTEVTIDFNAVEAELIADICGKILGYKEDWKVWKKK